ncbi:phosphoglucomutase/phosphomannomutase family protein, partial [bacterium]|nr:phosphoglucomutase/phosphomannomutase family protein [bacterium]
MADNVIKFGTDGWRGIIADTFTFENLALAAQAYADYLKSVGKAGASLVVGYDHRFLGKRFASLVSEILWGNGFKVLLSDKPLPTPA